jgi:hypothetical protein
MTAHKGITDLRIAVQVQIKLTQLALSPFIQSSLQFQFSFVLQFPEHQSQLLLKFQLLLKLCIHCAHLNVICAHLNASKIMLIHHSRASPERSLTLDQCRPRIPSPQLPHPCRRIA